MCRSSEVINSKLKEIWNLESIKRTELYYGEIP